MIVQLVDRLGGGGHESELVFLRSFRKIERKKDRNRSRKAIYAYICIFPFIHMFHDPENRILLEAISRLMCSL
jgi:hypothetical protein